MNLNIFLCAKTLIPLIFLKTPSLFFPLHQLNSSISSSKSFSSLTFRHLDSNVFSQKTIFEDFLSRNSRIELFFASTHNKSAKKITKARLKNDLTDKSVCESLLMVHFGARFYQFSCRTEKCLLISQHTMCLFGDYLELQVGVYLSKLQISRRQLWKLIDYDDTAPQAARRNPCR